jgi:hypothetical protein
VARAQGVQVHADAADAAVVQGLGMVGQADCGRLATLRMPSSPWSLATRRRIFVGVLTESHGSGVRS